MNNIKVLMTMCIIMTVFISCAPFPENIQPAYVSPLMYNVYSCNQLEQEYYRLKQQLVTVATIQKKAANHDTGAVCVGLLFFPVIPLAADRGPELAQIKGSCITIKSVISVKCPLLFKRIEQEEKKEKKKRRKKRLKEERDLNKLPF